MSTTTRILKRHIPLLIALPIIVAFSADVAFLRALKTEQTIGLWFLVLVPLASLLILLQLILWLAMISQRKARKRRGG